ncbi:hypothetical protein CDO73_18730 [Saccharibacillus sp. O23]|uniref:ABC transporter substrate-binding protein n=1 Tax=Saccharibacillus sp. O23 TaxID=2009338 RepID=UPI000B4E801F|nr:ABC transporter substrate-binding protein [Saccharibacillus sp. O23]OWR28312.1 hypothetical protein CDO73_18730 [Saccharibacillus sp. O23]
MMFNSLHRRAKFFRPLLLLAMLALPLSACGSAQTPSSSAADSSRPAAASAAESEKPSSAETSATRTYTDKTNREVEIPASPQRIVYIGSNPGDLLAIGTTPVGASLDVIATQVAYPDLLEGIEDVGYPYSLEKVTSLNPDLIIFDDWDQENLSKLELIAPTVVIGADDPIDMPERLATIGDVTGRSAEAEAWLKQYRQKIEDTRASLKLDEDATASSVLLLGKTVYIMGNQGFNQTLYGRLGLTPNENVQKLIDQDERFIDVSSERIPEYVGTEIFVLTDSEPETVATQNTLLSSAFWKTIPAVQKGRVHIMNSKWNFDDATTSERLLDELAKVINETK